jgi:hypothetical protein
LTNIRFYEILGALQTKEYRMITISPSPAHYTTSLRLNMLESRTHLAALAREMVANQVEAYIEMASEFPEEYTSYTQVKDLLEEGAKDSTMEIVDDLAAQFRDMLAEAIAATKVTVTAAKFDVNGVVDADVTVE